MDEDNPPALSKGKGASNPKRQRTKPQGPYLAFCRRCEAPFSPMSYNPALYCSDACKVAAHRWRHRHTLNPEKPIFFIRHREEENESGTSASLRDEPINKC